MVDDDLEKIGMLIHRIPVLGRTIRIPEMIAERDIGLIVFAINTIDPQRCHTILQRCWRSGARTVVAPDILNFLSNVDTPEDRHTGIPSMEPQPAGETPEDAFREVEVSEKVHEMVELARHGEYAELTRALEQLDRDLNPSRKADHPGVVQPRVHEEASQGVAGSD